MGAGVVITNNANLPESVVRAVSHDDYDYEAAGDISASALPKSPRQLWLERRHKHEILLDAADLIWRMIGNIGHKIAERAAHPNSLVEERLKATVLGWELTGKCDLLYENNGYGIDDFKFTSVWAVKDEKPEWTAQLNTYAWLAKQHGFDIKRLRIIAILRDWSKLKAAREQDYPPVGVVVREVPLWSEAKQENYIADRVQLHQWAGTKNDDDLPPCTEEERWAKPNTWAVKKKGGKKAIRGGIHDSESEAITHILEMFEAGRDHYIEHRPGNKTVRCASYCSAAPFCSQYQQLKKESGNADQMAEAV
jgi:hypothetical protein